jgi:long-chain fatty acid transport protein
MPVNGVLLDPEQAINHGGNMLKLKKWISLSSAITLMGVSSLAFASGFQLFEENAVGMGDFGAGGAAIAEDSSTQFFNPAGLVRINHQQLVASVVGIYSDLRFTGSSTWNSIPPTVPFTQTGNAHSTDFTAVPSLYYSAPIIPNRFALGLGVGVTFPFGLEDSYGDSSIVRFSTTQTSVQVLDISPSFGFAVTRQFSLGAGFDAERLEAKLNSKVGVPIVPGSPEAFSHNTASDWGYGWHAGALYQFTPQTRVGLAFHSQVVFHPSGTSNLSGTLFSPTVGYFPVNVTSQTKTETALPPFTQLSMYHDFSNRWAMDGTVTFTQWDVFKNIQLQNVAAVPAPITVNIPQGFRNTWRFALGGNFQASPQWLLRAGAGFDQNPTTNPNRNLRLPDGNRIALAVGTRFQPIKPVGIDVGYTHLFIRDAGIGNTGIFGPQAVTILGRVRSSADLLGAQVTWNLT